MLAVLDAKLEEVFYPLNNFYYSHQYTHWP